MILLHPLLSGKFPHFSSPPEGCGFHHDMGLLKHFCPPTTFYWCPRAFYKLVPTNLCNVIWQPLSPPHTTHIQRSWCFPKIMPPFHLCTYYCIFPVNSFWRTNSNAPSSVQPSANPGLLHCSLLWAPTQPVYISVEPDLSLGALPSRRSVLRSPESSQYLPVCHAFGRYVTYSIIQQLSE